MMYIAEPQMYCDSDIALLVYECFCLAQFVQLNNETPVFTSFLHVFK